MFRVCLCLLPGLVCYVWFFGFGVVIQCVLAVLFALLIEMLMLKLRKRNISIFIKDGSAVVTGLLFALTVTPFTPWWISLIGIAFAIIFAKHLYGGLGFNPFNPAMAGYIFVLLCFPVYLNHWPVAGNDTAALNEYIRFIFGPSANIDGLSGATPLAHMKSQLGSMAMISEIQTQPMFGYFAGKGWEWINVAFLLGGAVLLVMGIIKWQIPVSMLISILVISAVFNIYDPDLYASPLFHLFSGGTMLGAFFIATDPVTASTTPRGRIIYACMVGMIAYLIRVWGSYPDGVAFAVLIGNSFVPLIDRFTRPRVLGEK